jgi:hypothetical protein
LTVERLEDRTLLSAGAVRTVRLADLATGNVPSSVPLSARVAAYAANDSRSAGPGSHLPASQDVRPQDNPGVASGDPTPGDAGGDSYPIPPPGGPAQRGDVGVQPVSPALLLPLRDGALTLVSGSGTAPGSSTPAPEAAVSRTTLLNSISLANVARTAPPQRTSGAGTGEGAARPGPLALAMLLDPDTAGPSREEIADDRAPLAGDAVAQALSGAAVAKSHAAAQPSADQTPGVLISKAPAAGETSPGAVLLASTAAPPKATATPAVPSQPGRADWFSAGVLLRPLVALLLVLGLGLAWKRPCGAGRNSPARKPG